MNKSDYFYNQTVYFDVFMHFLPTLKHTIASNKRITGIIWLTIITKNKNNIWQQLRRNTILFFMLSLVSEKCELQNRKVIITYLKFFN